MQVREGMSIEVLTIGPDHTLREASRAMAGRRVGAAVITTPTAKESPSTPSVTCWPGSAWARTRTSSTCATT